jgi:hypothetical protein
MNGSNPYVAAREQAEAAAANAQDLNRLWWERLPMTYAAWAAGDRIDRGDDAAAA